jgi:hypothetical protein
VVESSDGARFLLKTVARFGPDDFQGDATPDTCITSTVDVAHTPRA